MATMTKTAAGPQVLNPADRAGSKAAQGPQTLLVPLSRSCFATEPVTSGQATGTSRRRLRAVALTGEPVSRYYGRLVIDLDTLRLPEAGGRKLPLLFRHAMSWELPADKDPRLGTIERASRTQRGIEIEASILSRRTSDTIFQDADDGYPWQLSVSVDGGTYIVVQQGQSLDVNGKSIEGPAYILKNAQLREVSLVEVGADPDTEMELLGRQGSGGPLPQLSAGAKPGQPHPGTLGVDPEADWDRSPSLRRQWLNSVPARPARTDQERLRIARGAFLRCAADDARRGRPWNIAD